jgi:hypothetical protein
MRRLFLGLMGKERETSFDISNLGAIRLDKGKGKLERRRATRKDMDDRRMLYSRSTLAIGGRVSVRCVTRGDGSLSLGIVWREGVVEMDLVEGLIEGIKSGIDGLCSLASRPLEKTKSE